MKPQLDRNHSHLAYLEPPHSHDPASVSAIATLPPATLDNLPAAVQSALYNLQQSTSIVYASYVRLQELLAERFDRLNPCINVDGDVTFCENSFFNYTNSLSAERTYLISDAHPDWRHKASLARVLLEPYYDMLIEPVSSDSNAPRDILIWWHGLLSAMEYWCDYARTVHIPDYEDTVSAYLTSHKQTPMLAADLDESPLETPLAIPTPTLEQEPPTLELYEIEDKDFAQSVPPRALDESKAGGLGLDGTLDIGSIANMVAQDYSLKYVGSVRDERKDSGVGMDD